jgi:hypothetical protein
MGIKWLPLALIKKTCSLGAVHLRGSPWAFLWDKYC